MHDGLETETCPICEGVSHCRGAVNGEIAYSCGRCGLWFYGKAVRNRPPTDEDWYTDPAKIAPNFLLSCRDAMAPTFERQIAEIERLVNGRSILDVGCGLGIFLSVAAARGWRVLGLEKNPNAAPIVRDVFGVMLTDQLNDIADESVDVVRLSHVLEHVANPVDFLAAVTAKLAPGGLAVAIVPNVQPFSYASVNAMRRIRGRADRLIAALSPGHHILGFNGDSLRSLFARSAMRPIRIFDVSMGRRKFYPMFFDGLMTRQKFSDFDARTLVRYWLPILVDNLGSPFGRGQWVVGYFKKKE